METEAIAKRTDDLTKVAALLGGSKVLGTRLISTFDAHDLIRSGLPTGAVLHLLDGLAVLGDEPSLMTALGMSVRTIQRRRKDKEKKALNQDQGGRTWKFAEILANATRILGSQQEAEQWLRSPARGLDNRRPIDLLATTAGTEMLEDFLVRLEYGVYV